MRHSRKLFRETGGTGIKNSPRVLLCTSSKRWEYLGKEKGLAVLSLFPLLFQGLYQFSVVETAGPGALVGRLRAQDPDLGDNALMAYSILDGEGAETFSISTDAQGRDGLLTIRKVCPTS